MLTAVTFVACLTACINPKHVGVESSGTVIGRVIDARTHDPIAAVMISDEVGRQTIANPEGAFSFVLPHGKHTLVIHADGYKAEQASIDLPSRESIFLTKDGYVRMHPGKMP